MASKFLQAGSLYRLMQTIGEVLDRDIPLLHVSALLRIAMAGDEGIDQNALMTELKISASAMSRIVQLLSSVHYMKDKEGFGYVERVFDPVDNRKRNLRLTAAGEKALAKMIDAKGAK